MALKELLASENARQQNKKEAFSSSSNSTGVTRFKELAKDLRKDLPIPVPF